MTTDPGPIDPIAHDAEGRIAADVACLTCGYNLRSRTDDDACPECGKPVRESLDCLLRNADPQWLMNVSSGAWMGLVVIAVFVFGGLVQCFEQLRAFYAIPQYVTIGLIAFSVVLAIGICRLWWRLRTHWFVDDAVALAAAAYVIWITLRLAGPPWDIRVPGLARIEGWILMCLFLVAAWRFVSPQRGSGESNLLRILIVVTAVINLIPEVVRFAVPQTGMWTLIWYAALIIWFLLLAMLIRHISMLALRLRDVPLARSGKLVMSGVVVAEIGWIIIWQVITANIRFGGGLSYFFVALLVRLPLFVFVIWAWVLLLKLALRLRALTPDRHPATDHSP